MSWNASGTTVGHENLRWADVASARLRYQRADVLGPTGKPSRLSAPRHNMVHLIRSSRLCVRFVVASRPRPSSVIDSLQNIRLTSTCRSTPGFLQTVVKDWLRARHAWCSPPILRLGGMTCGAR